MESPEYHYDGICRAGNSQFLPEKRISDIKSGDYFHIEDLLDFSNEELDGNVDNNAGNSTDSSTITAVETAGSCNSSLSGDGLSCWNYNDPHFSGVFAGRNYGNQHYTGELSGQSSRNYSDPHDPGDLCVPYDDLAELEWLSNFVEDSFSSEDFQKLQLFSGVKSRENLPGTQELSGGNEFSGIPELNPAFLPELSIRGKARSKRSRIAPCNWSSRILVLSPTTSSSESDVLSDFGKSLAKPTKKREIPDKGENRKCLHCATDKTPQWRTGPMGPKTLCNACGVRYKSGRLVPEYRPAASPTFVLTKHSNSHRKVIELRRQKEIQRTQQQYLQQASIFDVAGDDFFIHAGPDFRQLI